MDVFTDKGFKRPTYDELLEVQIARAKSLFGEDIDTGEPTALGKFMRINVYDISKMYEELEYVYYARFPNTATRHSLDRLCVFAGITRNQPTRAVQSIKLYGEANKMVENGFLVGTNDNITFYLINNTVLDANGEATTDFECTEPGTIGNVAIGSINKIINPDIYVTKIEHIVNDYNKKGENIETDVALRKRFSQVISGIGAGTLDSIYAEIIRVPNVIGCMVVENSSYAVDSAGRSPKSFECYVLGGDDTAIAQAIFKKAPVGIASVSSVANNKVTVSVKDVAGYPHTILFTRISKKLIYIKIKIKKDSSFETDGSEQIKSNLTSYINSLKNGEDVILSSLYSYIHKVGGVRETTELLLSVNGTTYTANNIVIAGHEVAQVGSITIDEGDYVDQ